MIVRNPPPPNRNAETRLVPPAEPAQQSVTLWVRSRCPNQHYADCHANATTRLTPPRTVQFKLTHMYSNIKPSKSFAHKITPGVWECAISMSMSHIPRGQRRGSPAAPKTALARPRAAQHRPDLYRVQPQQPSHTARGWRGTKPPVNPPCHPLWPFPASPHGP